MKSLLAAGANVNGLVVKNLADLDEAPPGFRSCIRTSSEVFELEIAQVCDEFDGRVSTSELGDVFIQTCTTLAKRFLTGDLLAHRVWMEDELKAAEEGKEAKISELGGATAAKNIALETDQADAICEMKTMVESIASNQIIPGRLCAISCKKVFEVLDNAALRAFDAHVKTAKARLAELEAAEAAKAAAAAAFHV